MLREATIDKGGYYPEVKVEGTGENLYKDGLLINAPGEVVRINRLYVNTVRSPIVIQRAKRVILDNCIFHDFHGDAFNIRQSNVHVGSYVGRDITLKLPYKEFHTDILLQAYAVEEDGNTLDPNGCIENITFEEIDIECDETEINVMMLSELNEYRNFQIGTKKLHIHAPIDWWVNGNNLSNSVFGCHDVKITGKDIPPGVFLKNRPKNDVCGLFESNDNTFFNIPNMEKSHCGEDSHIFDTSGN